MKGMNLNQAVLCIVEFGMEGTDDSGDSKQKTKNIKKVEEVLGNLADLDIGD